MRATSGRSQRLDRWNSRKRYRASHVIGIPLYFAIQRIPLPQANSRMWVVLDHRTPAVQQYFRWFLFSEPTPLHIGFLDSLGDFFGGSPRIRFNIGRVDFCSNGGAPTDRHRSGGTGGDTG